MRYFYLLILCCAGLAYPLTYIAAMERPPTLSLGAAATHATTPEPTPAAAALGRLHDEYGRIAAEGGWPSFPLTEKIQPNGISAQLPAIRRILQITGDLSGETVEKPELYDEKLLLAVKLFQSRHGLTDDGVIGRETQLALNTPVEKRLRQIEQTILRMQEFAPDASGRYLLVNIPEFTLRAFENGRLSMQMRVITGTPKNATPVFSHEMTYVSFNPHWGVPRRIAAQEMLPKILENPEFFTEQDFAVYQLTDEGRVEIDPATVDWAQYDKDHFPYLLRQRPGLGNALGRIKFGLKDSNDIYLHDTSNPKLFAKDIRAMSHGCIRVEKPYELAQFVFRDNARITPEKLDELYQSDESRIITIDPIMVHTVYWTAWVDENGAANFRKDVYGLD